VSSINWKEVTKQDPDWFIVWYATSASGMKHFYWSWVSAPSKEEAKYVLGPDSPYKVVMVLDDMPDDIPDSIVFRSLG